MKHRSNDNHWAESTVPTFVFPGFLSFLIQRQLGLSSAATSDPHRAKGSTVSEIEFLQLLPESREKFARFLLSCNLRFQVLISDKSNFASEHIYSNSFYSHVLVKWWTSVFTTNPLSYSYRNSFCHTLKWPSNCYPNWLATTSDKTTLKYCQIPVCWFAYVASYQNCTQQPNRQSS